MPAAGTGVGPVARWPMWRCWRALKPRPTKPPFATGRAAWLALHWYSAAQLAAVPCPTPRPPCSATWAPLGEQGHALLAAHRSERPGGGKTQVARARWQNATVSIARMAAASSTFFSPRPFLERKLPCTSKSASSPRKLAYAGVAATAPFRRATPWACSKAHRLAAHGAGGILQPC